MTIEKRPPACPFCDTVMALHSKYKFWKCFSCGGEWWPRDADEVISLLWENEADYIHSDLRFGGAKTQKGAEGKWRKKTSPS